MRILDVGIKFGSMSRRQKTDTLILHHREGNGDVQSIHEQHCKVNGWAGIGYHYYVRKDGSVYRGRPENMVGAHAGSTSGYNNRSIGICFEGNYMHETMPAAQLQAGRELIAEIEERYGGKLKIIGHRDVCDTNCPGVRFPLPALKQYKEAGEVVKTIDIMIDGMQYKAAAIEKDGRNYVQLRDLEQAGYDVTYDAAKGVPGILAPGTRNLFDIEVSAEDYDTVKQRAGLSEDTMQYLAAYEYGDDLLRKLAGMK